jgi:hypothetical protein
MCTEQYRNAYIPYVHACTQTVHVPVCNTWQLRRGTTTTHFFYFFLCQRRGFRRAVLPTLIVSLPLPFAQRTLRRQRRRFQKLTQGLLGMKARPELGDGGR